MKRLVLGLIAGLAVTAQAHFLFVVPGAGGRMAHVFLSEELKPETGIEPKLIAGAKLVARAADGRETPVALTPAGSGFEVALPGGTRLVHGVLDLGYTQRGASKAHILLYYPKTIVGDAFTGPAIVGGDCPVELVPEGRPGAVRLRLLARGAPVKDAEMTVILPDGSEKKVRTDGEGRTEPFAQTGRYGAWARSWEATAGEREGKKYEELRNYATLVFDSGTAAAGRWTSLPWATSSFGAVADEGWLYVYGGHIAPTHQYSTAGVSGQFRRIRLSGGGWEALPDGPALQGMNLAAGGGQIYRIGGMSPRNAPGQPADNHSVAECARFDPAKGAWAALPPLPEPRSSHDVAVVGGRVMVVGGWNMMGQKGQEWPSTMAVLDVTAAAPAWQTVPQPFRRRALIAAVFHDRLFAMGGMDDGDNVSADVDIYDPKLGTWTKGPKLPGAGVNPFAPAACVHDGQLYVSLADGRVYRLNEAAQRWDEAGRGTARLAHRMVDGGQTLLVLGGASRGGNLDLVESIEARP